MGHANREIPRSTDLKKNSSWNVVKYRGGFNQPVWINWKHHPTKCGPWGYPLKFERGDSNIHTVLKLAGWWNPTCVDTSCTTMYLIYIPTSSKGCCLNPKEWCIGTPHLYSAPFGRSRYIYIYMYICTVHQNKYAELQYKIHHTFLCNMQIYPMQATWLFTIKPSEFVFKTNILPYILYRWNRNHSHLRNDHTLDLPPRIQSLPPGWHHIFSRESQAKLLFATGMLGKVDNPNHTSWQIGL